jgi:hypothetical protein
MARKNDDPRVAARGHRCRDKFPAAPGSPFCRARTKRPEGRWRGVARPEREPLFLTQRQTSTAQSRRTIPRPGSSQRMMSATVPYPSSCTLMLVVMRPSWPMNEHERPAHVDGTARFVPGPRDALFHVCSPCSKMPEQTLRVSSRNTLTPRRSTFCLAQDGNKRCE